MNAFKMTLIIEDEDMCIGIGATEEAAMLLAKHAIKEYLSDEANVFTDNDTHDLINMVIGKIDDSNDIDEIMQILDENYDIYSHLEISEIRVFDEEFLKETTATFSSFIDEV
jgi:hypothetical protein